MHDTFGRRDQNYFAVKWPHFVGACLNVKYS